MEDDAKYMLQFIMEVVQILPWKRDVYAIGEADVCKSQTYLLFVNTVRKLQQIIHFRTN